MNIRRAIPNLLTLGNLACGSLAILLLFHPGGMTQTALAWTIAFLMVAAMLFDFADGFVARILKVASPVGKQLDSLSDMVSFGLLPGILVYWMLHAQTYNPAIARDYLPASWEYPGPWYAPWIPYVGLLIPLFSAYRLAKFNVDERPNDYFYGFPTPANAFFFLSIFLIYTLSDEYVAAPWEMSTPASFSLTRTATGAFSFLTYPLVLSPLTLIFSMLVVSDLPLLSFKFKNSSFRDNAMRYVLLGISVILLPIFTYEAMPIIIVVYFILSFIDRAIQKT